MIRQVELEGMGVDRNNVSRWNTRRDEMRWIRMHVAGIGVA